MSAAAVVMMIVAILVAWGGLALALVNLSRSAVADEDD
ncbi:methionine/alanine import family NSS transporter small subunit [Nocardioides sp. AE5]|nr:methionine/alanine import family NSS transporter small subunit [Nocardioides sp. AE5]MDT0202374.1 methionine/alanine import family NSS transporter small subunit [Nocardioides sp. AE5]